MQISSRVLGHLIEILGEFRHLALCEAASEAPEHAAVGPKNPGNVDVKPEYIRGLHEQILQFPERNLLMLALKRRIGESVYVNGPCIVSVSDIYSNQVQLTFQASESTRILRTEILNPEQAQKAAKCLDR
jgi:carbon storage regulator CsrA